VTVEPWSDEVLERIRSSLYGHTTPPYGIATRSGLRRWLATLDARDAEIARLREALNEIVLFGCEEVHDVGDQTCHANNPGDPDDWCPSCIAAVALAASALSGEGERGPDWECDGDRCIDPQRCRIWGYCLQASSGADDEPDVAGDEGGER
jgi:hypothetical protein